jgi:type II secretory pathway component PulC
MAGQAAVKNVDYTLSKKKLESAALLGDSVNTLRVVTVFRRGEQASIGLPEYRLFDIRKGSAFDIVGLQNADILQAANDYIIYQPEGLKTFVLQLLPTMPSSSIRVVRDGVPLQLNYKIVE